MDDAAAWLKWLVDFWPAFIAAVIGAMGWIRYGRKHGHRIIRGLALSDRLHEQFGENTALALSTAIHEACVEGAIREVRLILLEQAVNAKVYICHAQSGECTYANADLAELFGMDASDFVGSGWLAAVDRSERMDVYEAWKTAVRNRIPYEAEYTVVNQRTHERIKCRTKAYPAKLKTGELVWYVGTVEPIRSGQQT